MTTEELKMILETIGQIADGGTTAAIVWMALHYVAPLMETAMIVGGGVCIAIYVARCVMRSNEWAEAGKRVARAYGQDSDYGGYYERHAVVIDKAVAAAREKS